LTPRNAGQNFVCEISATGSSHQTGGWWNGWNVACKSKLQIWPPKTLVRILFVKLVGLAAATRLGGGKTVEILVASLSSRFDPPKPWSHICKCYFHYSRLPCHNGGKLLYLLFLVPDWGGGNCGKYYVSTMRVFQSALCKTVEIVCMYYASVPEWGTITLVYLLWPLSIRSRCYSQNGGIKPPPIPAFLQYVDDRAAWSIGTYIN
jgi:hypothetical protein